MRSRLAILLTLTLGFGLSGAGVGLAITGVASDGTDAAGQQYGSPSGPSLNPTPPSGEPTQPPLGEVDEEPRVDEPEVDEPTVRGETDESAQPETQETRQLGAEVSGGESLPFTGFAAIPVLIAGLALLAGGFALRRRGTDA